MRVEARIPVPVRIGVRGGLGVRGMQRLVGELWRAEARSQFVQVVLQWGAGE